MELILTVIRYRNLPPQQATTAKIGADGGTIGRGPNNDLSLPDEERWVSGRHARVQFRDGAFYLTDMSKNGTFVNQDPQPLTQGQEAKLHDGDELGFGAYEVRVSLVAERSRPAKPSDRPSPDEAEKDPFDEFIPDEDPRDIIDIIPPLPGPEPSFPSARPNEQRPATGAWPSPDSDSWKLWPPEGLDVPMPPADPDHTPDERAYYRPPNAIPAHYDPRTDESGRAPGTESTSAAESEPLPEAPPPARPDSGPAEPIAPAGTPATPAPPATDQEIDIAKAFLSGLGCGELPSDPTARARLMQTAGLLLRTMTDGLMRVLMARTSFKRELRLDMTTIRSADNNPFKFSANPEDALRHLLFLPSRGFLPAEDAASEAFDDIQRHEMAIIAGLRAALRAQLARLDPAQLEHRFRDRSVLDNLMPMARKAKCWDLFGESYGEVSADAAEDFMHLFGDAFSRAYEDQTQRLKKTGGS